EAMLHQRHQAGIEHLGFTRARHPPLDQEIEDFRVAVPADQFVDEIAAAHRDRSGVRGGNVGLRQFRHQCFTSLVLYSLRGRLAKGTRVIRVATTSFARIVASIFSARPSPAAMSSPSSTSIGSGGSCRVPGAAGLISSAPLTSGRKPAIT